MTDTKTAGKSKYETAKESKVFDAEERAAMRERAKEVKAEQRRKKAGKLDAEDEVLAKIAEMPASDRAMAERLHEIVKANAPELRPKTWYGMPAYARDGNVVVYFTAADKFKSRYATLGFNDRARLDDGSMWATSWAITKLTPADEKRIVELVKKA